MTHSILIKMQEKDKKSEKKPATAAKGMKRAKTTVNLGKNKLDKKEKPEKAEKPGDNKHRKNTEIKSSESDAKKNKLLTMNLKTEPNEIKEKESTKKKGDKKD